MNARINELMANMRTKVLEPQVHALEEMMMGGDEVEEAAPQSPAQSELDDLILGIEDNLVSQFEVEAEEALDLVLECADDLENEGQLPPLPDDDSSDEEVAQWLNEARKIGFAAYVADQVEDEEEPEGEEELGESAPGESAPA